MKTLGSRVPHCSYSIAIKRLTLLRRFYPNLVSVSELKKETKNKRISTELSFLTKLNFVERPKKGLYRLTNHGQALLDPKRTEEQKKAVIQHVLNESYQNELIGIFQLEKYDRDKVIAILREGVGGNWQDYFAQRTVTRFLSFLRAAGYIEGKGRNTILKVIPCSNCSSFIELGAEFCTECGISIEEEKKRTQCPECGEKIKKEWKFCKHCGSDLKDQSTP